MAGSIHISRSIKSFGLPTLVKKSLSQVSKKIFKIFERLLETRFLTFLTWQFYFGHFFIERRIKIYYFCRASRVSYVMFWIVRGHRFVLQHTSRKILKNLLQPLKLCAIARAKERTTSFLIYLF